MNEYYEAAIKQSHLMYDNLPLIVLLEEQKKMRESYRISSTNTAAAACEVLMELISKYNKSDQSVDCESLRKFVERRHLEEMDRARDYVAECHRVGMPCPTYLYGAANAFEEVLDRIKRLEEGKE